MKLQLTYTETEQVLTDAVFLRGDDLAPLINAIEKCRDSGNNLSCYLVPSSILSTQPAGIFVTGEDLLNAFPSEIVTAYQRVGNKLYIPTTATLFPQASAQELDTILLWDVQLFHPVIGLVGFEHKDKLEFSTLFHYPTPVETKWMLPNQRIPDKPVLSEISITPQSAASILADMQKEIGQKPLHEIGHENEKKQGFWNKLLDNLSYPAFKGLYNLTRVLQNTSSTSDSSTNAAPGVFQKFQTWLKDNIDNLEEKRKDEISRLLSLFDENTDEALQYAIPLDSPYFDRGKAPASSSLTKRPINFNLGKLGGGGAVDSWDLGDHYQTLRAKYLRAAEKELKNKDYNKSAYIYAHLLGDYSSAANVLEQGKMYREAAALYKDHVKNIAAAAQCLERGGLYLESIELFKQLNEHEKTGDLYRLINQPQKATEAYERQVAIKETNSDYLDAGRLVHDKMEDKERARSLWLQGWQGTYYSEPCLQKYFQTLTDEEHPQLEREIENIYVNYTPQHKRMPLLNILEFINGRAKDEKLQRFNKNLAFGIVHEEAESGNLQSLHALKKFLPGDRLITSDASRYISKSKQKLSSRPNAEHFHLDQNINWLTAVVHHNQFIAIGKKNGCFQMVRANWYWDTEYYSWSNQVESMSAPTLLAASFSNNLFLQIRENGSMTKKVLPKNKYFPETLVILCPSWMHRGTGQVCIRDEKTLARLESSERNCTLHIYSKEGGLRKSTDCHNPDKELLPNAANNLSPMACYRGHYYTYSGQLFFCILENGLTIPYDFQTNIRHFAAAFVFESTWMVISCNTGCYLMNASQGSLKQPGEPFATSLIPVFISFVSAERFVLAEKNKAHLFEIQDGRPALVQQYETHHRIIAILPTNDRTKMALVEETGRITLCGL